MGFVSNYGTRVRLGSVGLAPVFYDIPGVYVVPPLEREQGKIETTHHGSGPNRTFIPSGLTDPGDYSFEMRVDREDDVQRMLYGASVSGEARPFRIVYPNGYALEFEAQVLNINYGEADATSPDVITATVKLAIAGDIRDVSEDESW